MADIYETVAENMTVLRKQAEELKEECRKLRHALAFARSVIKSGESWTEQCETIIGGALNG